MTDTPVQPPDTTDQRKAIGGNPFQFKCHPYVTCYQVCCHKVELRLFPYDIIRLKNHLSIHSAAFIEQYARIGQGGHPYFPAIMLNMADVDTHPCPFLVKEGCSVYRDRPSACRTYPLERAVEKSGKKGRLKTHYFMTDHSYCKGHLEDHFYTVKKWERQQRLLEDNLLNDMWAEVDAFFATNPWQGEGHAGSRQQMAFMVCYNIDGFRSYMNEHNLLSAYSLDRDRRRRILVDDVELLKFGLDWLLQVFGDRKRLIPG